MRHYETSFFTDDGFVAKGDALNENSCVLTLRSRESYSSPEITVFFPAADVAKVRQLADFINELWAPETEADPKVEAFRDAAE